MKPPFRYSCETDHEILDDDGLFVASCGDEADARELVRLLNRPDVPSEASIDAAARECDLADEWAGPGDFAAILRKHFTERAAERLSE